MTRQESTKILHAPYFQHPRPDVAEELFLVFRNAKQAATNIGVNTCMLALLESLPESQSEELKRKYRFYVERAESVIKNASMNSVGWNDHHMSRWLFLGKPEDLQELRERSTWGGRVGDLARWMIRSMIAQCPEFARQWGRPSGFF